jgi:hypothetical protein
MTFVPETFFLDYLIVFNFYTKYFIIYPIVPYIYIYLKNRKNPISKNIQNILIFFNFSSKTMDLREFALNAFL